jgi:hypothetical protein
MIKRLVVREVRDCWQAALLLVLVLLVLVLLVLVLLVLVLLVPPQVPPQVLNRLANLSERLLLGV